MQFERQVEEVSNERQTKKHALLGEASHHARKDALKPKLHSSALWGFTMETLDIIKELQPPKEANEFQRELLNIRAEAHRLDLIDKEAPKTAPKRRNVTLTASVSR